MRSARRDHPVVITDAAPSFDDDQRHRKRVYAALMVLHLVGFVAAGLLANVWWLALVIILALIAAVSVTVLSFGPISRAAGLLLLPYITWLVFAATLNLWAAIHN